MLAQISWIGSASLLLYQGGMILLLLALVFLLVRTNRQRTALLQEKAVVLGFMQDIGEVLSESESVDMQGLLRRVVHHAVRTTGAAAGVVYLVDQNRECLRVAALSGVFPPLDLELGDGVKNAFSKIRYVERLVREQPVRMGQGIVGAVVTQGVPFLCEEGAIDQRVPKYEHDFLKINSLLMVPMRFHHEATGVIAVVNPVDGIPFSATDRDVLQALADQAAVAVHYARFSAALDEKRKLDYDLGVARKIQMALLPRRIPQVEGLEIAAFSEPAQQVGGDYYDFIQMPDGKLGVVIADVAGKGISGALLVSECRSLLRVTAQQGLSPVEILTKVNRMVGPDISEDKFISMLYAVIDPSKMTLTVARAGHTYPIVHEGVGEPVQIKTRGMAVGLGTPVVFEKCLEEKTIEFGPGSTVVLYTDGVLEARDRQGREWGLLNLLKTIQQAAFEGEGAPGLTTSVHQKLLHFVGDTPQYDDMTLVAIRRPR